MFFYAFISIQKLISGLKSEILQIQGTHNGYKSFRYNVMSLYVEVLLHMEVGKSFHSILPYSSAVESSIV